MCVEINGSFIDGFLHKNVKAVMQPGVTQTPQNCLEFTLFFPVIRKSFLLVKSKDGLSLSLLWYNLKSKKLSR